MRLFVFLLVFPLAACPWLGISEIADSVQQTIKDHTPAADHDHCGVFNTRCDSGRCWCYSCAGWCPVPFDKHDDKETTNEDNRAPTAEETKQD